MSTKFFNNASGNTLFEKLRGIARNMATFDRFLAVAGYFRSSGYFKLRAELKDVKEIKILVGINIDDIFRHHDAAQLFLPDAAKAKEIYEKDFTQDIVDARYGKDVEDGIRQMCDDMTSGRLQMRIHSSKNLHAKFYLCLPANHSENSDGWVIMGSSNLTDSGLGTMQSPRYELNVAMKDYDDVKFCRDEFDHLWQDAVPLSAKDIDQYKQKTYLGYQPTPYELYIKVLIDTFGAQVEDEFDIQLPDGVLDLKYQRDAVIQGYQMMMEHNGFFLADVVGLGKTVIATMIAKRFIEANGIKTNVLVVYPPSVAQNWRDTFRLFGIGRRAQFVTNGSLDKINNGEGQYKDREEYDLVIVDEAHGFRKNETGKYGELEKICKAPRGDGGMVAGKHKKVMLLSATPLNNTPEDLYNLLLLFQNSHECTIDGIPDLQTFFAPLVAMYKQLMRRRKNENVDVTGEVDKIYAEIRAKVIDKVTVRRTRSNILNDPDYTDDLRRQGISFPTIGHPVSLEYTMGDATSRRFYNTIAMLTTGDGDKERPHITYARYRAIEFLKPELQAKYKNALHVSTLLAGIYRVLMVKRLESSFHAFKKSLLAFRDITAGMIEMFNQDKVIIAPDINVKGLQADGLDIDDIIRYAKKKGFNEEDITYKASDFDNGFLPMLVNDKERLDELCADWEQEHSDPKYDVFIHHVNDVFFSHDINKEGKLVVFSESVDTLDYLYDRMTKELHRADILMVDAGNRTRKEPSVKANFDANSTVKSDDYNILLSSDVLAEGINLHRANVIVNYDSPWNATKLIQRLGRVNRIGSTAGTIHNFLFYPSRQGDEQIQLYKNALIKLQGFHSAFGEDAQIYSTEEIVRQFELYDSHIRDNTDRKIELLREVRAIYNHDRQLYHKIKSLPMKSRVMRYASDENKGQTIVFVKSDVKTEFYRVDDNGAQAVDFLTAADILRADKSEKAAPQTGEERHYSHVVTAVEKYKKEYITAADTNSVNNSIKSKDKNALQAAKFLRTLRQLSADRQLQNSCEQLLNLIRRGVYQQLPKRVIAIADNYKNDHNAILHDEYRLQNLLTALLNDYAPRRQQADSDRHNAADPSIIISESFV